MKNVDKKNILAIFLAILAIVAIVISLFFKNDNNSKANKISIVTNYNDFYTVDSCIYRTITYINGRNNENLSLVLSEDYKKKKKSMEETIVDFNIPENATFTSKKMYYQNLGNNIVKYYVYGHLLSNIIDQSISDYIQNKKDAYFIVYLDTSNLVFSIEPYDGKIFMGGDINEQ